VEYLYNQYVSQPKWLGWLRDRMKTIPGNPREVAWEIGRYRISIEDQKGLDSETQRKLEEDNKKMLLFLKNADEN
jgi:hypothetical protein